MFAVVHASRPTPKHVAVEKVGAERTFGVCIGAGRTGRYGSAEKRCHGDRLLCGFIGCCSCENHKGRIIWKHNFTRAGRQIYGIFVHVRKFVRMVALGSMAVSTDIRHFIRIHVAFCMTCVSPLTDKPCIGRY